MSGANRAAVFDIDGTLSNPSHRLHFIEGEGKKDWDSFFAGVSDDSVHYHVLSVLNAMSYCAWPIYFFTGRSEDCREETVAWLKSECGLIKVDGKPKMIWQPNYVELCMRKHGDHREDFVVKGEMVDALRAKGVDPTMAFEDRSQCVKMFRERGIPCLQVAPGDF